MESGVVVTVNIRNIAVGGEGVGEVVTQSDGDDSLLGISAFVPFAAPGEIVSARVVEQKKRYLRADLLSVDTPSEVRISPTCKYFSICGGCELQHLSYEGQLQAKSDMIAGALKAARLGTEILEKLLPIVPASPYQYRRRITLHVDAQGKVGFYRGKSRSVVPIDSCSVAISSINQHLGNIQTLGKDLAAKVSSILLEADGYGVVAVLKSPYDLPEGERQWILSSAKRYFPNVVLMVGEKEITGSGRQILELPLNAGKTLVLRVPAGSFSQVNWDVNLSLIARVVQLSKPPFARHVYDLYAGAGNFALPVAKAGAQVVAVESNKRLVIFARENIHQNRLEKNLEFVETSVEKFLTSLAHRREVDVLIADPPRSGLGGLIPLLPKAKRLLLISCHLPSFTRDIKALVEAGWKVTEIRPFDMFAQTSYSEILSVFERG